MLREVLENILTANDYSTDLGLQVRYGPPEEGAEYDVGALFYWVLDKQISSQNLRWEHRVTYQIEAVFFTNELEEYAASIEQDIWTALASDPSLGGRVDNLLPAENAVEVAAGFAGKQAVHIAVRVQVMYKTQPFKASRTS